MLKKIFILAALIASVSSLVHAQTPDVAISPAKRELILKFIGKCLALPSLE